MIIDPRVRGQITVMSSTAVDADTYYQIFLRALDVNGFTAVETSQGMVSIVPTQDARAAPLPFADFSAANSSQYVTEAFQLENVSVSQVLPVLRPLVSQSTGQMSAYPAGNMIVLVDTVANVERIRQILTRIDQSSIPETEIIRLQFASAREMVVLLRDLQEESASVEEEPATTRLQINADERSNSVLVKTAIRASSISNTPMQCVWRKCSVRWYETGLACPPRLAKTLSQDRQAYKRMLITMHLLSLLIWMLWIH
jgi:general secretion pathway protein D